MGALLLGLSVVMAVLRGPVAAAAPAPQTVDGHAALVISLEADRTRLENQTRELEQKYQAKTREIGRLKAERASWNRDRKLGERLGEAKEMAGTLDARKAELGRLTGRVDTERRALVEQIDRELGATPPPEAAQRDRLVRLRADTASRLRPTGKKITVADERIDPLDDPEDLDAKAAALAQSEALLRAEEKRLAQRAGRLTKLARLERSRQRAAESELFGDGPRRRTGHSSATSRGGSQADPASGGDGASAGQEFDGNSTPPLNDDDDAPPGSGSGGGGGAGVPDPIVSPPAGPSVDVTIVYADVVQPGTLAELRNAEQHGDTMARARAAERASADLRARAERLRQKRLEMERRAHELRERGE